MVSTYLSYRIYARDITASLKQVASEPTVARDKAYYEANIGKVKSVDDFLGNYRLYSYAMKAYGLDDMINAKAFMKKVLQSDLTSSSSFANKLTDSRYKQFASTFSFSKTGAAGTAAVAQTSDQEDETIGLYTQKVGNTDAAAVTEVKYYSDHIGSVKTVADLLGDTRLYDFVTTAYGIDSDAASYADVASVLKSDASDKTSFSATLASSGTLGLPLLAQSTAAETATAAAYAKTVGTTADDVAETTYYTTTMAHITSVDTFLADPRLVSYAKQAYGLTDASVTTDVLRQVLTSDLSNPLSVAKQLGSAATALAGAFTFTQQATGANPYLAMTEAFNFGADGNATAQRQAQSKVDILAVETRYTQNAGSTTAAKAAAKTETSYYQTAIQAVGSLDDLLGDARLVAYITKAFGLAKDNPSTDTLRKVLTSDLSNPKSVANTKGSAYQALSAAFSFTTTGTMSLDGASRAQSKKNAIILGNTYMRQTLENEAGDQNDGVRLALYFQRKVPVITSAYSILADKALLKVAQTALGLPTNASNVDIDVQARQIENRLKIADLSDPKKLDHFLAQFTALYDISESGLSDTSGTLTLLGGS